MADSSARLLGDRLGGGVVAVPGPVQLAAPLEVITGGHPVPTPGSRVAGARALEIARAANAADRLLVLLSGGASALMAVPADGVTLDDKRLATDVLLRAGADIQSLNAVRKHLSAFKGGWLAAEASAPCLTLAISDVVGDDLSVIGSGPTVADATTFEDAVEVLRRHGGVDAYPPAVVARLQRGAAGRTPETPKPGDARLARGAAWVIGGRHDAMSGGADAARRLGYRVLTLDEPVVGEARHAAPAYVAQVAARAAALDRPLCVISSGETTVRVAGAGRGGRNQEFALAAATALAELGTDVVAASVGTDGVDGPTDAAGAIVDSTTLARARQAALRPQAFLDDNDAYTFFTVLGDLIQPGPTGTNVGDLQVFLLA